MADLDLEEHPIIALTRLVEVLPKQQVLHFLHGYLDQEDCLTLLCWEEEA